MNIAIDFDDTLMDTSNVQPGYRMGPPTDGAILAVKRLADEGHYITVFTGRNVQDPRIKKAVVDWLDYFQIPFHGITNVKSPSFEIMIDNRALHYQSWTQTLKDLKSIENHFPTWDNHAGEHQQPLIEDITKPLDQQITP